jgi:exonuclease VII large subunit
VASLLPRVDQAISQRQIFIRDQIDQIFTTVEHKYHDEESKLTALLRVLSQVDPRNVLARGYALIRGDARIGAIIEIENAHSVIKAEVKSVGEK